MPRVSAGQRGSIRAHCSSENQKKSAIAIPPRRRQVNHISLALGIPFMGPDPNSIPTINQSKAIFDDIYVRPDPRSYYQVLGELDYMIPDVAEPIIRQLLDARANLHRQKNVVIDVGCSYGINAAIHRFPVSFRYLQQRYAGREMMQISPEELIKLDRAFYSSWPELRSTEFIGLDAAAPAIDYANRTGLH